MASHLHIRRHASPLPSSAPECACFGVRNKVEQGPSPSPEAAPRPTPEPRQGRAPRLRPGRGAPAGDLETSREVSGTNGYGSAAHSAADNDRRDTELSRSRMHLEGDRQVCGEPTG